MRENEFLLDTYLMDKSESNINPLQYTPYPWYWAMRLTVFSVLVCLSTVLSTPTLLPPLPYILYSNNWTVFQSLYIKICSNSASKWFTTETRWPDAFWGSHWPPGHRLSRTLYLQSVYDLVTTRDGSCYPGPRRKFQTPGLKSDPGAPWYMEEKWKHEYIYAQT